MGVLIPTDQVLVRKDRKRGKDNLNSRMMRHISQNREMPPGEQAATFLSEQTAVAAPQSPAPKPTPKRAPAPKPQAAPTPTRSLKTLHLPRTFNPYLAAGGVLGVAGGGAYLAHRQSQKRLGKQGYQRRRVEKSLSSMQPDFPSVMMSTT